MTLDEVLSYIEQGVLPECFGGYDSNMRNYALVANGITYMQRTENAGIIGGDLSFSYTSRQRYKGCIQSFEKHKMVFDELHNYSDARFSFEGAYQAMVNLMEKKPDLTAVFAMSDVMAIGAARALKDMGKRVPEDISVIGFDGITLADYYNPKLRV